MSIRSEIRMTSSAARRRHVVPKRLCFLAWRAQSRSDINNPFLSAGKDSVVSFARPDCSPLTVPELTMPSFSQGRNTRPRPSAQRVTEANPGSTPILTPLSLWSTT